MTPRQSTELSIELSGSAASIHFDPHNEFREGRFDSSMGRLQSCLEELTQKGTAKTLFLFLQNSSLAAEDTLAIYRLLEDNPDAAEKFAAQQQRVLRRIADLPMPTVAVLSGRVFSVNLEVALACRIRLGIRDSDLQLGFYEAAWGVTPPGGTAGWLVRKAGVDALLDLVLLGKSWDVDRALRQGLIDEKVDEAHFQDAAERILQVPKRGPSMVVRRKDDGLRRFEKSALQCLRRNGEFYDPAKRRMVDVLAGWHGPETSYFAAQQRSFAQLIVSRESRYLRRLDSSRIVLESGHEQTMVRSIAVIGVDVPAADIVARAALNSYRVRWLAPDGVAMGRGLRMVTQILQQECPDPSTRSLIFNHISAGLGHAPEGTLDAAFDFRVALDEVSERASQGRLILGIQCPIARPGALCLHWSSGTGVEVEQTAIEDRRIENLLRKTVSDMGRMLVPIDGRQGFVVPRLQGVFWSEALRILDEDVTEQELDESLRSFGFRLGPIEGMRQWPQEGLAPSMAVFHKKFPERYAEEETWLRWVDEQSASGTAKRKQWRNRAARLGGMWIDRCHTALVIEAWHCLAEQGLKRAKDIDLLAVFGFGYPAFWGGPLRYSDYYGPKALVEHCRQLSDRFGPRFAPPDLLVESATSVNRVHEEMGSP